MLNAELQSFADNLGACERIKKTPIPYAYSLFLKKIIFIYVFTMPIGFVLDYSYWAVLVVTLPLDAYPRRLTRSTPPCPIKSHGFPTRLPLVPLGEVGEEDTMGQAAGDVGHEESNP